MPWVGAYHAPNEALAFVRQFRAKWLTREDLIVGIFDLAGGRLLGGSGLHRIDWQIRRFEIGYWLRQSAEGHGYVVEAVQLLIRLAFEVLAANRVEIRTDVRNSAAVQCLSGSGSSWKDAYGDSCRTWRDSRATY